jgi:hypothetical protein
MSSPAHALSDWQKAQIGLGAASLFVGAAAVANGYGYEDEGYYGEGRAYRRAARSCARRWGWHTWKWERCMENRGF